MASETIDLTPTWAGVLRLLLAAHANGGDKARQSALIELRRMAELADLYVVEETKRRAPA